MSREEDIKYMQRCLDLAAKAEGYTYPNPLVGSVIVHGDKIIGEGFHLKAGQPHAEAIAINSVVDKNLLGESTLYVNLEPCSHFGKTPPCADLIISNKIPRVVLSTPDTNIKVSGKGIQKLKEAGCEVVTGILVERGRRLNRRFFTFHEKKRPYITLKWAESADGFIDRLRTTNSKPGVNWITGFSERSLVHKWRAEEQAILVGGETMRNDNPRLDVRLWRGNNPLRIVLSSSGVVDCTSFKESSDAPVIVFTHQGGLVINGAEVIQLRKDEPSALQIVNYLYEIGVQSVFIEGGRKVIDHFLENGLWDEARVFTGNIIFEKGLIAPLLRGKKISESRFSSCTLRTILNE